MKKNMIMRFASLLLVVTLLSTCAISGTFAKYTSEKSASDSATVAEWSFKVGGKNIAKETFAFDLFTGEDAIIAPGTAGSLDLVLKNESEVPAQYAIKYTVTNTNNIPIQFSVDGGSTWKDTLDDVTASEATKLAVGAAEKTIKVQWKWAFEADNEAEKAARNTADTTLGTAGTAQVTVAAAITATQVG